MSEQKQQYRVRAAALALTFLLGGVFGGGYWMHGWWQGQLKNPDFVKSLQGGPGPGAGPGGPPAAAAALVRVDSARLEQATLERKLVGRLYPVQRATVSSEVSGKILSMNVREGSAVTGGKTVIASIDPVWLELSISKQEARIKAIEAQLRKDKENLKRLKGLFDRGVATDFEYSEQLAAHDQRVAELAEAQVALKDYKVKRGRVDVIAPFDGWVTVRHAEQGQWLNEGSSVVDIVSRGEIYALINVPESLVNRLKLGLEIPVAIDVLGETVTGRIGSITPDGSQASRSYPVRVVLNDLDGRLKVGMSVTGTFPEGARQEHLLVSRDAVLVKPDGSTVWVVQGSSQQSALPAPVDIIGRVGTRYAIRPQNEQARRLLGDGGSVVIEGAERLRPGQAVRLMDPRLAQAKPVLAAHGAGHSEPAAARTTTAPAPGPAPVPGL